MPIDNLLPALRDLTITADATGRDVRHWADGGPTDLDNGCLLCTSCHAQIHASDWDIIMGSDRHPWLLPPVEQDPTRTPIPASNRRTMRLDGVAA